MAYRAVDIAKYIINKCTVEGQTLSNLQLQKILYFTQRDFLLADEIAFNDDFEAWKFGPVIPEIYYMFCGTGSMGIPMTYNINLTSDYTKRIDPVVISKRNLEPWDLVKESHKIGGAWDRVYNNGKGDHCIIPRDMIKTYG